MTEHGNPGLVLLPDRDDGAGSQLRLIGRQTQLRVDVTPMLDPPPSDRRIECRGGGQDLGDAFAPNPTRCFTERRGLWLRATGYRCRKQHPIGSSNLESLVARAFLNLG